MRRILPFLLSVVLLTLGSCAKKDAILETIPADSWVTKYNIPELVRQDLKLLVTFGLSEQEFATMTANIDAANFYCVSNGQNRYFTVAVTNHDALKQFLSSYGTPEEKDGVTYYGSQFGLSKQQFFYSETGSLPQLLAEARQSVTKGSIAEVEAAVECLNADKIMSMVVPVSGAESNDNKNGTPVSCMLFDLRDDVLNGSCRVVYPDGSPYTIDGLQQINTSVLSYVPGGSQAVIAAAFTPSFDWEGVMKPFLPQLSMEHQGLVYLFMPYLKSIDGTLLMSFTLVPGEFPQFTLMAHMAQDKVDACVASLVEYAGESGLSANEVSHGVYSLAVPGAQFFIGSCDGYLTVATSLPSDDNTNNLAAAFQGKTLGAKIDLPSNAVEEGMPPLRVDLTATQNEFTLHIYSFKSLAQSLCHYAE